MKVSALPATVGSLLLLHPALTVAGTCSGSFGSVVTATFSPIPAVQKWCSSKYPISKVTKTAKTVTVTSTVGTATSTYTAPKKTTTITVATNTAVQTLTFTSTITSTSTEIDPATFTQPETATNTVLTTVTLTTTPPAKLKRTVPTSSKKIDTSSAYCSLTKAPYSVAASICSCLECTTTVLVTATTTLKSTAKATISVTPTTTVSVTASATSTTSVTATAFATATITTTSTLTTTSTTTTTVTSTSTETTAAPTCGPDVPAKNQGECNGGDVGTSCNDGSECTYIVAKCYQACDQDQCFFSPESNNYPVASYYVDGTCLYYTDCCAASKLRRRSPSLLAARTDDAWITEDYGNVTIAHRPGSSISYSG